jgi:hemolysin III
MWDVVTECTLPDETNGTADALSRSVPPGHGGFLEPHTAPVLPDEEWANALTHAIAAMAWMFGAVVMVRAAATQSLMTTICCLFFVLSAVSVFSASALSHHLLHCPRLLNRLRAWDQGLIYAMISGTYTPLIWQFASPSIRVPLLVGIWVAAAIGFHSKVFASHRINGIGTITYLLLGWVPALGLIGRVPGAVLFWMTVGGVIYTADVVLLMNDKRLKYLHAGWHLCVVIAASCHFWAIYRYVATA